jgi:peptide chain release factor 2
VFQPYQMVKDHRTGYEVGQVSAVMDGDVDGFIEAYLKKKLTGGLLAPAKAAADEE